MRNFTLATHSVPRTKMTISGAVFASLEQLINQLLRLDPEARQHLLSMHGRVIKIDLIGLGISLFVIPDPAGIQLFNHYEGQPDCTLRGTPLQLARMGSPKDSVDQLFSREVQIEGDSALAQQFGELLASMEIDWEEQLSRLTGDVIAHEIGSALRKTFAWGRNTAQTLQLDLQETLQEEWRLTPTRYEIEPFITGVDRLRDDAERLQARVQRLAKRIAEKEAGR